ncbi:hypothetical protein AGMMS49521_1510 [Campylobacterota bacterium]|nr:hypothetical protein AGMMS49521_1510 [Campylobacterota bacterium]GHV07054.1 hypothetical protein AGMMS50229_13050 [Campylobacterota bacterium]
MNSKASLDRELTQFLEKRYNKVFLDPDEVERETLVNPKCVPSTSDKHNTWLLRDVVEFINRPFYNKELTHMCRREKKAFVIKTTTDTLNGLWGKVIPLTNPVATVNVSAINETQLNAQATS